MQTVSQWVTIIQRVPAIILILLMLQDHLAS